MAEDQDQEPTEDDLQFFRVLVAAVVEHINSGDYDESKTTEYGTRGHQFLCFRLFVKQLKKELFKRKASNKTFVLTEDFNIWILQFIKDRNVHHRGKAALTTFMQKLNDYQKTPESTELKQIFPIPKSAWITKDSFKIRRVIWVGDDGQEKEFLIRRKRLWATARFLHAYLHYQWMGMEQNTKVDLKREVKSQILGGDWIVDACVVTTAVFNRISAEDDGPPPLREINNNTLRNNDSGIFVDYLVFQPAKIMLERCYNLAEAEAIRELKKEGELTKYYKNVDSLYESLKGCDDYETFKAMSVRRLEECAALIQRSLSKLGTERLRDGFFYGQPDPAHMPHLPKFLFFFGFNNMSGDDDANSEFANAVKLFFEGIRIQAPLIPCEIEVSKDDESIAVADMYLMGFHSLEHCLSDLMRVFASGNAIEPPIKNIRFGPRVTGGDRIKCTNFSGVPDAIRDLVANPSIKVTIHGFNLDDLQLKALGSGKAELCFVECKFVNEAESGEWLLINNNDNLPKNKDSPRKLTFNKCSSATTGDALKPICKAVLKGYWEINLEGCGLEEEDIRNAFANLRNKGVDVDLKGCLKIDGDKLDL